MQFALKNSDLQKLDLKIFKSNKAYGMALTSLNSLPNPYATKQFIKSVEFLKKELKEIKTTDDFEILFIENSILNLDSQVAYLRYFTLNNKEKIKDLISFIAGKTALEKVKESCKNFNYKRFWDYYLSYQEYTYRQIPSDDENLRPIFKTILKQLKIDILKYGKEHFNFPKDYDFDLSLGQPYSKKTYFQPTIRRMEISPSSFFVFKDNSKIKINVCSIISSLFHEIIGHGRQEINSRFLPKSLQDNSINTSVPPLHIHSEGVAQITKKNSIDFMKEFQKKYEIENDFINQMILSMTSEKSINLLIYYQYLQLKKLENPKINIEKEFKNLTKNPGLYLLYESNNNSPLSCIKNLTYPVGLIHINSLLNELKEKLGEDVFEKNHSIINQAISIGVWHFRVLPKFVKFVLRKQGFNIS